MISEIIEKWIKGILIDGITGNLSGLFDNVNAKVGEIASDVGSTPQAWNSGIFNMLRSLSETVVLPIAAAILALVMCHELIQMITEKNNMHDFDTSMFFRWIFKSAFAILIVSNTWNIVMGVFDATQSVVNQSSGVIIGETSIHFDRLIPGLEFQLESMTIGSLLSLWFQTLVVGLTMNILSICIFLVTYGRMIEIYVVTALGPIPLATMGSSEWRSTGQNYLKSLLALGFQAFLMSARPRVNRCPLSRWMNFPAVCRTTKIFSRHWSRHPRYPSGLRTSRTITNTTPRTRTGKISFCTTKARKHGNRTRQSAKWF